MERFLLTEAEIIFRGEHVTHDDLKQNYCDSQCDFIYLPQLFCGIMSREKFTYYHFDGFWTCVELSLVMNGENLLTWQAGPGSTIYGKLEPFWMHRQGIQR